MLTKLNPFAKPTVQDLKAKELKQMQEALYQAEMQVDYYQNQIQYYKTRIEKLESMNMPIQDFTKRLDPVVR